MTSASGVENLGGWDLKEKEGGLSKEKGNDKKLVIRDIFRIFTWLELKLIAKIPSMYDKLYVIFHKKLRPRQIHVIGLDITKPAAPPPPDSAGSSN